MIYNIPGNSSWSVFLASPSRDSYIYGYLNTHLNNMGWLWFVGSIKLHVSFAEYSLFCRALLQKRPVLLSILLTKATPYIFYRTNTFIYIYIYICVSTYLCMCIYSCMYMHIYIYEHVHTIYRTRVCDWYSWQDFPATHTSICICTYVYMYLNDLKYTGQEFVIGILMGWLRWVGVLKW